jgi:hypothetical protein
MENNLTLEQRVEVIERELNFLKAQLPKNSPKPWWQKIAGIFENDPAFDEILALGQAIREQERLAARS